MNAAVHMHGLPIAFLLLLREQQSLTMNDICSAERDQNSSPISLTIRSSKDDRLKSEKVLHHSFVHLAREDNENRVAQTASVMDLPTHDSLVKNFRLGTSLISLVLNNDVTKSFSSSRCNSVDFHAISKLEGLVKPRQDSANVVLTTASNKSLNKLNSIRHPSKCVPCLMVFSAIKNSVDFSLLKNVPFLVYYIGLPMAYFGQMAPLLLLPIRAVHCGIDRSAAAFLVSILGICNVVSRLLWGKFSDIQIFGKYKPFISGGTAILDGITSLLSYLAKDYISFAIFAAMWGTFSGRSHFFGFD